MIDVLPTVRSLMTDDDATPLFETNGHHLSGLGVRHAGELVARRLERYELEGRDRSRFSEVERMAGERITPAVPMRAWEVQLDGEPYRHVPRSPVIVIGDSHASTYQGASWSSHLARAAGIAVTDISKNTGAPTAHARLAAQGLAMLKERRVVVWIISASHMERWPWRTAEIRPEVTIEGLVSTGQANEAIRMYQAHGGDPSRLNIREADVHKLACALLDSGQTAEAIRLFTINTELFPSSANAFGVLGRVRAHLGDDAKAIESLKEALSLYPTPRVRDDASRLLAELGVDWEPPAAHVLSPEAVAALVSEYDLDGDHTGVVGVSNGRLVCELVGGPVVEMQPLSDVLFTSPAGYEISFTPAKGDEPTGLLIRGRGLRLAGRRKP